MCYHSACVLQGMGEGEGAKDVSDQITDEDQLLGVRQKDQPPPEQARDAHLPLLCWLNRDSIQARGIVPCTSQWRPIKGRGRCFCNGMLS